MAKKKPQRKPHPSRFGELKIPKGCIVVDGAVCNGEVEEWDEDEKPDVDMRKDSQ